jgi:hypothetical protein
MMGLPVEFPAEVTTVTLYSATVDIEIVFIVTL